MAVELVVQMSRRAGEASRALQALKVQSETVARNTAVLIRAPSGEVVVFETGNVDLRYVTLLGAVVSVLVEPLGEFDPKPIAAHGPSFALTQEWLAKLRGSLQPGGSALVILVETDRARALPSLLAAHEGRLWQWALSDDLVASFATADR
jgi:hypothetical protein